MKYFLTRKVWPVVAGLLTAFIVMLIAEYINSLIYPLPEDLDWMDTEAVQAFTASLPWTAFVLVLLGWVLGSFKAGCVTAYLSKERSFRLPLLVGVILTILGIINNATLGHPLAFNIIGLPVFIIFTYLGHRYLIYRQNARAGSTPPVANP